MSEIESLERPSQEPYKRRLLKGSPFCSDCGEDGADENGKSGALGSCPTTASLRSPVSHTRRDKNMIPTNCPVCGLDLKNEKVIAEEDKRAFCSVACVLTEHPELRRCLRVEMIL